MGVLLTAIVLAATLGLAPGPRAAAEPGPVTDLRTETGFSAFAAAIAVGWAPPPREKYGLVCWIAGTVPVAVPGPPARCEAYHFLDDTWITGVHGQPTAITVFAGPSVDGPWGPPASTVVTAIQLVPSDSLFEEFYDWPLSATSVELCWGGDGSDAADSWAIYRARGTDAPPAGTVPEVIEPGHCYRAHGLDTDVPYTFAIAGRNEVGEGPPGIFTVSSRLAGGRTNRSDVPLPGGDDTHRVMLAFAGPRDDLHAGYVRFRPVRPGSRRWEPVLYDARLDRSGEWAEPVRVSGPAATHPQIAGNEQGTLVAAWHREFGRARYRVRAAGARSWGRTRRLDADYLDAVAVDRRGRLHFLITEGSTLYYRTNATGRWTQSRVPGGRCRSSDEEGCTRRRLMAYDPTRDRLVLVVQGDALGLAEKRARARAFGRLHQAPRPRGFMATSVTMRGGQITVGLARSWAGPPKIEPAVYVMSGDDGAGSVGGPARVPGTGERDADQTLVLATRRDRALVAWMRSGWDGGEQGIWLQERTLVGDGRWEFAQPAQRISTSFYDELDSLALDAAGEVAVGYHRR